MSLFSLRNGRKVGKIEKEWRRKNGQWKCMESETMNASSSITNFICRWKEQMIHLPSQSTRLDTAQFEKMANLASTNNTKLPLPSNNNHTYLLFFYTSTLIINSNIRSNFSSHVFQLHGFHLHLIFTHQKFSLNK